MTFKNNEQAKQLIGANELIGKTIRSNYIVADRVFIFFTDNTFVCYDSYPDPDEDDKELDFRVLMISDSICEVSFVDAHGPYIAYDEGLISKEQKEGYLCVIERSNNIESHHKKISGLSLNRIKTRNYRK